MNLQAQKVMGNIAGLLFSLAAISGVVTPMLWFFTSGC